MTTATATRERDTLAQAWTRLRASPLAKLLAIGALSRVLVVAGAWAAGAWLPAAIEGGWNRGPLFVRYFARWDSGFYMDIAEFGYGFKPEAWAFNPGYPAAIALVHGLFPFVDYPLAGFLVSNAAFFASVVLLYKLTTALFDEPFAWRASAVFAFFPSAFYASAVYAEALFLVFALGTFLAAHRGNWLAAGALASLAAVTRPPGVMLIGALGLALLIALVRDRKLPWTGWAALPVATMLPAAFAAYCWARTGDPFISNHVREEYWPNVQWHSPFTIFDFSGSAFIVTAHVFVALSFLVLVIGWIAYDVVQRRRVAALPVYAFSLVMAVIYLAYSEPVPIVRYLLPILPAYWAIADATARRGALQLALGVLGILSAVVAALFATWVSLY